MAEGLGSGFGSAATPRATAGWRHVKKRIGLFLHNFGFVETRPSLVEPPGEEAEPIARDPAAPLGGDATATGPLARGLRTDALSALALLYARAPDETASRSTTRFQDRWSMAGEIIDPRPLTPGRHRSYQAIAAATFGVAGPEPDAELLSLVARVAADLKLRQPELRVGSVGTPDETVHYRGVISATARVAVRCPTCAASDVLRLLVCDEEPCRALAQSLPPIRHFLGATSQRFHDQVLDRIKDSSIPVTDDPSLAVGAHATRTVFALTAVDGAGARRTVAIGTRRDQLVGDLGGPPAVQMVGVTFGVERGLVTMSEPSVDFHPACEVYIASQGEEARRWALKAALAERSRGFRVELELREVPWAAQLERAKQLRARVVVLAGQAGRDAEEIMVRDVAKDETKVVNRAQLSSEIKKALR